MENENIKKKKFPKALILIVLVLVVALGIGFAFARYVTKINGQATADVAQYSFNVTAGSTTNLNIDLADTRLANDTTRVESGYVAPGTAGAFNINVDASNSDVSLVYNININTTNVPKNLHFYVDEAMKTEIVYSNNTFGYEGFIGYSDQTKSKTQTVYWNWPYETGETEEEILANDEDDSTWIGHEISLTLNITGKQVKAEPRYLAKVAEPGTYVDYVDGNGNTINCVVMYNDSTYGLQLISIEPTRAVTLGYTDPKISGSNNIQKAINSYNRAIVSLNEYAMDYLNTDFAYNARCVGSRPNNKNYPNSLNGTAKENFMFVSNYEYTKQFDRKMYNHDANYYTDDSRLAAIGKKGFTNETYGTMYWIASRSVAQSDSVTYFVVWARTKSGDSSSYSPLVARPPNAYSPLNPTYAFRPVFYIKNNVKIASGEGTENLPYQLTIE